MSPTIPTDSRSCRDLPRCGRQIALPIPFGGGVASCSSAFAFSTLWRGIFIPASPAFGRGWWLWLLILFACLPVQSQAELKPFQADSLMQITESRAGRPFLLMLWSLDCPPCLKELAELGRHLLAGDAGHLVLVSTDGPSQQAEIERLLHDFGLTGLDNWQFADAFAERLRYRIDPNWFGELPRAYFYDADHRRSAHSGMLDATLLRRWLEQARRQGSSS